MPRTLKEARTPASLVNRICISVQTLLSGYAIFCFKWYEIVFIFYSYLKHINMCTQLTNGISIMPGVAEQGFIRTYVLDQQVPGPVARHFYIWKELDSAHSQAVHVGLKFYHRSILFHWSRCLLAWSTLIFYRSYDTDLLCSSIFQEVSFVFPFFVFSTSCVKLVLSPPLFSR